MKRIVSCVLKNWVLNLIEKALTCFLQILYVNALVRMKLESSWKNNEKVKILQGKNGEETWKTRFQKREGKEGLDQKIWSNLDFFWGFNFSFDRSNKIFMTLFYFFILQKFHLGLVQNLILRKNHSKVKKIYSCNYRKNFKIHKLIPATLTYHY